MGKEEAKGHMWHTNKLLETRAAAIQNTCNKMDLRGLNAKNNNTPKKQVGTPFQPNLSKGHCVIWQT